MQGDGDRDVMDEDDRNSPREYHAGGLEPEYVAMDPEAERQEREHYQEIINAFAYYTSYARTRMRRVQDSIDALPTAHMALLEATTQLAKWQRWDAAIDKNAALIALMLRSEPLFHSMFGMAGGLQVKRASAHNMDKVCSTLRQFVREWSAEGASERRTSLDVLLDALVRLRPLQAGVPPPRVLCPGSGLGRLPFDCCRRGYAAQGNEWSFFMLVAGNFVLNETKRIGEHEIAPFIHQSSNVRRADDMFRIIPFPDISPSSLPPGADFSYTAGGFHEVYSSQDQVARWDAVLTCFFLDTANNVLQYLDVLWKALKPGGLWLNLGPLLYHYSELDYEQSVELTLEEVRRCAQGIGFRFLEERNVETTYCCNALSMMSTRYEAAFWAAEKPLETH